MMTVIENEVNKKPLRRVFFWTGKVTHIVDENMPSLPGETAERRSSLCGLLPMWPGVWFGEANDEDRARAESMPTCGRCAYTLEGMNREQRA